MKKETAIERAFEKCNLIGEDVDIYKALYSYKAIRELPQEEIDHIYDEIAERLGFVTDKTQDDTTMTEETVYSVYCDGDLQSSFRTLKEAQDYVQRDIKGMAECYGKTQKQIKEFFRWTIEEEVFCVE